MIINHVRLYSCSQCGKKKEMTTVIAFQKSNIKPSTFMGPAQILMFTGVRQERLGDDAAQPKTKRRMVTRQSQIALEDLE
jgi:hypothetical protein